MPTFGRPRMATRIASSPTAAAPPPGRRATISSSRSPLPWPCSAEIGTGSPSPRPVELERVDVASRIVDLVREHDHRRLRDAQDLRQLLVPGRDAGSRVDDEEDEVGLLDRERAPARRSAAPNGPVSSTSTPPVSISRNHVPLHSQSSSLRSRVTPGVSCTTAARDSVSRLTSVDLPTFGKPTIATGVRASVHRSGRHAGGVAPRGRPSSCMLDEPVPERAGSRPARSPTPRGSRARPSAGRRSASARPTRSRPGGSCRASRSAEPCTATRTTGLPPAARPSPRPAAPRPGRPARWRVPSTKSPSAWPSRTICRIVRTASRSDSPRRTEKVPKQRISWPRPGTRCASIFAM